MNYWYYIYDEDQRPIIRWEYARDWSKAKLVAQQTKGKKRTENPKYYCRGHVQGDLPIKMNRSALTLNDVHTPTGYVTVEDIARFCIEDLGVKFKDRPKDWHQLLLDSYAKFCQDFTRGEEWDGDR
ncbi:MAG: hypothetical protein M1274_15345 [Actinobacteria bacterium]|nr:hypothetical protein [Actinomycetota bacterium]